VLCSRTFGLPTRSPQHTHRSFGIVWKGVFRLNPVAIKTCRVTKVTARMVREFMGELKLMAPLSHANLVGLVGGCWNDGPDKLCLVLEFCERGTLKDLLVATATHGLKHDWENPFYQITLGIAACFRYFHHEQPSGEALLHRDLKPENVLVSDNFEAKVSRSTALFASLLLQCGSSANWFSLLADRGSRGEQAFRPRGGRAPNG